MNHSTQRGFTLIEVLAALIIVALGMLAVIEAVTQTINNANYLREKTIAHWLAMNKLTEVRLATTAPPGGDTNGDIDMAGTTWHWRMTVTVAGDPRANMQRIDVYVAPKSAGDKASIASVAGFFSPLIARGNGVTWDPSLIPPGSNGLSSSSSSAASSNSSAGASSSSSSSLSSASSASS